MIITRRIASLDAVRSRMNARSAADRIITEKRVLGAYYTPERLSDILSDWAIKRPSDLILEPSFGGCGFLRSATRALSKLGARDPKRNVHGCDIDPVAFEYLADVFGSPIDLDRFLQCDFLEMSAPTSWPAKFNVVLGNPPYIPFQKIPALRRAELNRRIVASGRLGGRASLWAYFVSHSISMLDVGGRMAWVLPGSYLHASYAEPLRSYVCMHFDKVACFVIHERLFLDEGTDEETVILLAEGFTQSPHSFSRMCFSKASTLSELETGILDWDATGNIGGSATGRPAHLDLNAAERKAIELLAVSESCQTIGELADVSIGVVTGANDFFVLSNDQLLAGGMHPGDCEPVVSKFRQVAGLRFKAVDHAESLQKGFRGHLVDGAGREDNTRVSNYLSSFPEERRLGTATFRKRANWCHTSDQRTPDAFFPVMHHLGPRLALNDFGCTSTNTIHRVFFRDGVDAHVRRLLAVSLLCSFSQVSAEIVGRRYGSGVLKHEPSEAKAIAVLIPKISVDVLADAFDRIDTALRCGRTSDASDIADGVIIEALPGPLREAFAKMGPALQKIRKRRHPDRRKKETPLESLVGA